MKTYEFKLPDIGEGVTEGEIVKWLISPGDLVVEDQPIIEVMTDKATVTITAPKAGKVLETRGEAGSVVQVHSVLVVFDLGGDVAESPAHVPAAENKEPAATAVGDIKESLPGMNLMSAAPVASPANGHAKSAVTMGPQAAPNPAPAMPAPSYFNQKPLATPATRALARELGVDLRTVPPTGPNGRVTKDDVRALGHGAGPLTMVPSPSPATTIAPVAMRVPPVTMGETPKPPAQPVAQQHEEVAQPAPAAKPAPTPKQESLPLPPATTRAPVRIAPIAGGDAAIEERIPLRGVRKKIFEGMARSKHTAAHFTFVEECDVSALKELRARLRPAAEKQGVKLTFLPFFVKAVVAALKKHPTLNAAFDESTQEIVVRKYYDIGIASATDAGLIVPVVRNADRKSILDVARDIQRLGEETKSGKVRPEDLGGSTFTITSLGQQGGLFATPILNFPEVAILGIHQMKQKPVVRDGQIVVGDVMLLSLSFDHRIIDGHIGAAFAYEIIGYLENPDRLFLEMA
jgi:pyruvate dehydrogenase E2 component (dihydrolipoamide acetyltransferase)